MNPVPKHIAIILDGNRRWAKKRGLPSFFGHKKGADNLEIIGEAVLQRGIKVLTVWAFSTENWKRTKREVAYMMKLLKTIREKIPVFMKMNAQVVYSGRIQEFSADVRQILAEVAEATKKNTRGIMNIALNYGGQAELVDAVRAILKRRLKPSQVTPAAIVSELDQPDLPPPDLIIRTGGEQRLSGFMPWQSGYSELYFTKRLWPEFNPADLDAALEDYAGRERRFGK